MHYILGKAVKDMYADSLFHEGEVYPLDVAKVYSSKYQRTEYSAIAHLDGIFPKGTGERVDKDFIEKHGDLLLPPMVTHQYMHDKDEFVVPDAPKMTRIEVIDPSKDKIFHKNFSETCPALNKLVHMRHMEIIEEAKRIPPIMDVIKEATKRGCDPNLYKKKENDIQSISFFADTLASDRAITGNYIKGFDDKIFEKIERVRSFGYIAQWLSLHAVNTVMTSGMTKVMMSYFKRKIENYKTDRVINDVRYLGFSGHELNVLAYLKQYKMTSMDC